MSASASLSVDVVAVVVTVVVTVREDTADVMLVERARRAHHLESSLLNCESTRHSTLSDTQKANKQLAVVVSDVVPDVAELLLLLRLVFRYACSCIRQKFLHYKSLQWLG